ncbi:MAG TPA: thioesterase family protein [Pseudomonadota bacterium]|nr:thioesterase family protein [Pseudomonadota bacterium]HNO69099.1 thioesterase family protein [Pseudomonadota bacterium]
MKHHPPPMQKNATPRSLRRDYRHFLSIPTRFLDNDVYGHVNNVVYYSFFDTVINEFLIAQGGLDIHHGAVIGLAVETQCRFFAPLSFPQIIDAGLRIGHLGRSSVRYEIGLFAQTTDKDSEPAAAEGHFVHVFVDRETRTSTPIPDSIRTALARLAVPSAD